MRTQFLLDFVGVGAARCGTSWLATTLAQHPKIFIPERKELHYFNLEQRYRPDLVGLTDHFAKAHAGQKIGEFTPRYAIRPTALQRIRTHFPDIKVLFSIRDPIGRARSQYHYFRSNKGKERIGDFLSALEGPFREDYIGKSQFAGQLQRLHDLFGPENVKVVVFENMIADARATVRDVFRFLGVDPDFEPAFSESRRNESVSVNSRTVSALRRVRGRIGGGKNRPLRKAIAHHIDALTDRLAARVPPVEPLPCDTRAQLMERFFADDVRRLTSEFGLDLGRWQID